MPFLAASESLVGVGPSAEAEILRQNNQLDMRKGSANKIGAAVGRAVIHNNDFVCGVSGKGFDYRRKIFFEKTLAVPVWNNGRRSRTSLDPARGRLLAAADPQ